MFTAAMRLVGAAAGFVLVLPFSWALSGTAHAEDRPAATEDRVTDPAAVKGNDGDAIIVTGSRIARQAIDDATPIQTLSSDYLDTRGFQTLAQALNEQPNFGVPDSSPIGFNQSRFGAGQAFVNFLGLGSQRTLVLVDGMRFISSNSPTIFGPTGSGGGQVDLNTIPTKLIDRVETVAAIGAPVYGSDAIAGTINIILKKNYQGLDLDMQDGLADQGDAPERRIRLLAGRNFAGGRGNFTLAGEYDTSGGLLYTDRAVTAQAAQFAASPSGTGPQQLYTNIRVPGMDPSGIPLVGSALFSQLGIAVPLSPQQSSALTALLHYPKINFGVTNATGQSLRFTPTGGLTAIDFGQPVGSLASIYPYTSGGNGWSQTAAENLLTALKRYSLNGHLRFAITPKIHAFAEGWWSVSEATNLATQPAENSNFLAAGSAINDNLKIPLSNPFLSDSSRAAIKAAIAANPYSDQNLLHIPQNYFYLARANTDLTPGVSTTRSQVLHFAGGIEATLNVLPGKEWHFEATFTYGQARATTVAPELNEQNFLNAINAVTDNSGNIVCAPGITNSPASTISATCAPLNLFGQQTSQAARDYVTSIATSRTVNNQYDAVAAVSGPLARLPGGALAFALGFEHRAEDSRFDPGAFFYGAGSGDTTQRTSYGRAVPVNPSSGSYHTNELFGELTAEPISPQNHVPGIYALSFGAAGRMIWNSYAATDPTWTVQTRWAPIRDIALRAAYTSAVRAPSITEAFATKSSAYAVATDPCDASHRNQGPDPVTRAANCASVGIPASFTSTSSAAPFLNTIAGSPNLESERSHNFTAGLVATPSFLPGLTATVDYVAITIRNAISAYSGTDVLNACYDTPDPATNPFCKLVTRNSTTHQISLLGGGFYNAARMRYKGILASLDYRRPTPFVGQGSTVGLAVSYQYLNTLTLQQTATTAPSRLDDSLGYAHHKGLATFTYDNRRFAWMLQMQLIGSTAVDPNATPDAYSPSRYGAFTSFNTALTYRVNERFSLRLDIDNLFGANPPYPYPAAEVNGGAATYFTGVMGRYIRVGAGVHF